MDVKELENYLTEVGVSYKRFEVISQLAKRIEKDKTILESIKIILDNCKNFENLKKHNLLCSYCIHILVQSQRPESMFLLIQHIKSLPKNMPFAYVEFLGRLLPFFGKIIIGPAKELAQYPHGTPQNAIGIQTLCNLFLDGLLGIENTPFLVNLIEKYEHDLYFTLHLIEMVKSTREYRKYVSGDQNKDEEDFFLSDDILIEKKS